jgi:tetratricopeptide (TPR) repeat protein
MLDQLSFDASIASGRKTLELEPSHFLTYVYISWAYRQAGALSEALDTAESAVRLAPNSPLASSCLGTAPAVMGRRDEARRVIDQLERRAYVPSGIVASIHAALGNHEDFFQWTERASRERSAQLVFTNLRRYDLALRADPRFTALLEQVGIG